MTGERSGFAPRPPRLATWLAGLRLPHSDREFQLGDLAEEFHRVLVPDFGVRAARRWYWRQALRCLFAREAPTAAERAVIARRGGPLMFARALARDVSYAFRLMRRTPLVATAAVLTFALGIGANSAIFSVAKPVLLDPLPFPDEDRLAIIWLTYDTDGGGLARNNVSAGDYGAMREARAFERVEAFNRYGSRHNLIAGGEPRQVTVGHVTAGFFSALGVRALAGRPLVPADAESNAVVIAESLWASEFERDPGIAGRRIRLDGGAYEIVGVVPDWSGTGTRPADAWVPLAIEEQIRARQRSYPYLAFGRLRADASLEMANEQLAAIMARLAEQYPETNGSPVIGARAFSFREELTGPVRPTFLILVGGAVVVLVIAALNLAGLQLVRQAGRRRELAVRQAVGASRPRLVGLLIADSVVQAGVGGAVGLLCASMTLALLRQLAPPDTWYQIPARPTWTVVTFTAGLAIVTGLVVGLLPALRAASLPVASAIRSRMSLGDRAAGRGRTVLVIAQVAMTLALLTVASLVGASLARLLRVDPGFTTTGLLIADFRLPESRYGPADTRTRFYQELVERLEAQPGAERACVANDVPLDTDQGGMTWVAEGDRRMIGSTPKVVSPGCFEVLGVPLLAGRVFEARDETQEVILSRSMALALWPDEPEPFNPVGRRIHMGTADGWQMTVIGMAGDIRNSALESDYRRQVWLPHSLGLWPPGRLILSGRDSERLPGAAAVRSVMRDLDPSIAVANVRTMDDVVASATASRRFVLFLLGGFGVVALLLSGVGIHGVLAHAVAQRTPEIGVRMALGATRRDIARLVTGRVALSVVAGTILGVAIALASSAWVSSVLYDTSATDTRVYAGAALFVALIAGAAAWSPTRRAVRIDPLGALRQD